MNKVTSETDWDRYRVEFPIAERYVYFNHAAVSPLSRHVSDAVQRMSDALVQEGFLCVEKAFERLEEVRCAAARLIGAESEEIAFVKNTSQGVLMAANGIHWRPGDNIVMPSLEFPSNVYPWMQLGSKGIELKLIEPDQGRITADKLADACNERTRAVTVSYVQFSNGYRIDLEGLGSFCRSRNIHLHVDAIQALGMIECDVKKLQVDFLSAGGHKWLLSPPGIGLFFCRKELISDMHVWNPGWASVINRMDFLDYDLTYRDSAARFEEGAHNMHGIMALGASVERFLEIGMTEVEDRIYTLTGLLERELAERGYLVTSPRGAGEWSGILSFKHPKKGTDEIFAALSDSSILTSVREGSVRLSPHFYNNEEDIKKFFAALP